MNIVKVAQSVLRVLLAKKLTVINDNWDSPDEGREFTSDEDVEDFLVEDNDKDNWVLSFNVKSVEHKDLEALIKSVLGDPTQRHDRADLPHKVNNWCVKNVLVVHQGTGIEFFEDFERVSRKRK